MSWIESLRVGLQLAVMGMGAVFLLLALLWLLLTLLLRADRPPAPIADAGELRADVPAGRPRPSAALLAAIAVAVTTHRAAQRKQAAPSMRSHWPGSLLYASRWVAAGRHVQNQTWHPRQR